MYPFIGSNYAFKHEIFADDGLFRNDLGPGTPTMGEDTEFIERLMTKGKTLYYCGKALVWHPFDSQRMNLRHIAQWHIALGKFDTQRERKSGKKFFYYFGVPRYLFKGMAKDFLFLIANIVNKKSFYNSWRRFFRKVGMITEYRFLQRKHH